MKPLTNLLAGCMGFLIACIVFSLACENGSPTEVDTDLTVTTEHGTFAVQRNGRRFDVDAASLAVEQAYADAVRQVPKLSRVRYAFNVIVEPEPFRCSGSPTGWCHGETIYPLGPVHNGEGVESNLYHEAGHVFCGYLGGGAQCCSRVGHDVALSGCVR